MNQRLQELFEKEQENPGAIQVPKRKDIESEPTTPTKENKKQAKAKKEAIVPEDEEMEPRAPKSKSVATKEQGSKYSKELTSTPALSKTSKPKPSLNQYFPIKPRGNLPRAMSQEVRTSEEQGSVDEVNTRPYKGYRGVKDLVLKNAKKNQIVPNTIEKLKNRLRRRNPKSYQHKLAQPAQLIYRSHAYADETLLISKRQIRVARRLWKNAVAHGGHYAKMSVILDGMIREMKRLNPTQAIFLMLENLSFQFKSWVIQGNAIVRRNVAPINFIKDSSKAIMQMSLDIKNYFQEVEGDLHDYFEAFEPQLIDAANEIGMDVITVGETLSPALRGGQVWLLRNNFEDFIAFYRMFLRPYALAKNLDIFFCGECINFILSTQAVVDKQTHLEDKIFCIEWLSEFATELAEDNLLKVQEAWRIFKNFYLEGIPVNETHRTRKANNLEMPALRLPGDNFKKSIHECFIKSASQRRRRSRRKS